MNAVVTTFYPFGKETRIIVEDANTQEINGDFVEIFKKTPGAFFGSYDVEDRAIFRGEFIKSIIFEEVEE